MHRRHLLLMTPWKAGGTSHQLAQEALFRSSQTGYPARANSQERCPVKAWVFLHALRDSSVSRQYWQGGPSHGRGSDPQGLFFTMGLRHSSSTQNRETRPVRCGGTLIERSNHKWKPGQETSSPYWTWKTFFHQEISSGPTWVSLLGSSSGSTCRKQWEPQGHQTKITRRPK